MSGRKVKSSVVQDTTATSEVEIKEGPVRPYIIVDKSVDVVTKRTPHTLNEKLLLAILIVIAVFVRFHKLGWPNSVVYDENHYGNLITKYANNEFFLDAEPPMVRLLYNIVAKASGYEGNFKFTQVGALYTSKIPYIVLRSFAATLGLFTIILTYSTLRLSGANIYVAFATSLAFIFENAFATTSRLILPDSPIIFFIALAVYAFKKSELYTDESCASYKYIIISAIAAGCASSSKWVGLCTIVWLGLLCIWRFTFMMGDLSKPVCKSVKHTVMKGGILIIIPVVIYLLSFAAHISLMTKVSDDSEFIIPEYQSSLIGNNVPKDIKVEVGVGSSISLRHTGTTGGYLHSHQLNYPKGSEQQQITLYPFVDELNDWTIELYDKPGEILVDFQNLTDRTKIRLLHNSHCRLHSHDHKAPVSENADWQKEVSCYGYDGFEGDPNDDWIIEIDKDASTPGAAQERVRAIETKFRLRHAMTGCMLFSHSTKLPEWGVDQQEVTCASSGIDELTLWYVERNENFLLAEDAELISYPKLSFFQKFVELHKKMFYMMKKLDSPHPASTSAFSWPTMSGGVDYWSNNHRNVYFLGNATLWWSVSAFLVVYAIFAIVQLLRWQVGKPILQTPEVVSYHMETLEFLLGYAVHFVPFIFFGNNLFISAYLPAYYFGILSIGLTLNSLVTIVFKTRSHIGYVIVALFVTSIIYFFNDHKPLVYGTEWTRDLCNKSVWSSSWDYPCKNYFGNYQEYKAFELPEPSPFTQLETHIFTQPRNTALDPIESAQPVAEQQQQQQQQEEQIDPNAPSQERVAEQEAKFDDIMNQPGQKVFKDEFGNVLDPEEVKKILAESNAVIKEKHIVNSN